MPTTSTFRIIHADALAGLRELPDQSVNCCVTSPPYWGLRDYGTPGQIGLERAPEEYTARLVEVFAEVRRVLRNDGTLWLNLGDSYSNDTKWGGTSGGKNSTSAAGGYQGQRVRRGKDCDPKRGAAAPGQPMQQGNSGLKPKNLVGIPWRVAFALQADGWWLRSDIIWAKPNPMPESVTDRPTRAHEYLFLLSKSAKYYYDSDAIKEPGIAMNEHDATGPGYSAPGQTPQNGNRARTDKQRGHGRRHDGFNARWDAMERTEQCSMMRNRRTVWSIAPANFKEAHFATFPPALVEPCILAGCPVGGTVLDPFSGSGTTGVVALRHERKYIGIELNEEYVAMSRRRIVEDRPLFNYEGAGALKPAG